MNVACPECSTVYRLDPGRLPDGGATTRCRSCGQPFRVSDGVERAGVVVVGEAVERKAVEREPAPVVEDAPSSAEDVSAPPGMPDMAEKAEPAAPPARPVFGPQDPETRARRLARALVSDIKVYNAERWEQSRAAGTLRKDFRDEILKSWDEYVEQVGEPMAKKTPYFRDALNDILAGGGRVF